LFEELNKMGTTVVIATHNEGLVGRFSHRQLRIAQGTVKLVDPGGQAVAAEEHSEAPHAAEAEQQESA